MYVEEKKLGETNIDDVGKVLLEAADYIEWHGWCQHVVSNAKGEVCAMGAIAECLSRRGNGSSFAARERVWGYLSKYLNGSLPALALEIWNDMPGRTKEQVVAALRGAARS